MKIVTLRELESLTGKHHKFLKQCLEGLPFASGPNRARLYESPMALAAIYGVTRSLEEARTKQAEAAARLSEVRADELARTRIPIEDVLEVWDEGSQHLVSVLKVEAAKGRPLTRNLVNDLLDKLRAVPEKWTRSIK
jgi:hypothetical protein